MNAYELGRRVARRQLHKRGLDYAGENPEPGTGQRRAPKPPSKMVKEKKVTPMTRIPK